ncbi:Uncharacterised protein [Vibrio cholerae]|nr:Uncharacterised protein [Vibrio cholerae]CSB51748.1 Uncharacterised protein [Vibrio cholerae]CSB72409.1 Uncharacterised protein [Vibrio cholerae]CSI64145.1 Uncharacterised protein [Vibrio cholerae]
MCKGSSDSTYPLRLDVAAVWEIALETSHIYQR